MAGPNPTREVTEKSAREFERTLGLPVGVLDLQGWDPLQPEAPVVAPAPAGAPAAAPDSKATVADVIRLIGVVSAAEKVAVPPLKFPDLVALAFADSMDHGGVPRENFIKDLVHLLK